MGRETVLRELDRRGVSVAEFCARCFCHDSISFKSLAFNFSGLAFILARRCVGVAKPTVRCLLISSSVTWASIFSLFVRKRSMSRMMRKKSWASEAGMSMDRMGAMDGFPTVGEANAPVPFSIQLVALFSPAWGANPHGAVARRRSQRRWVPVATVAFTVCTSPTVERMLCVTPVDCQLPAARVSLHSTA